MRRQHSFLKRIVRGAAFVMAGWALSSGAAFAQSAKVVVDAAAPGVEVSKTLYGIFFEEINRGGDGGLYAEMVQNRSFEDAASIPVAWELSASAGSNSSWALDRSSPLNKSNPTSLRIDVRSLAAGASAALVNSGFVGCARNGGESDEAYSKRFAAAVAQQKGKGHGIAVRAGAEYLGSAYLRVGDNGSGPLIVRLEKQDGSVLGETKIEGLGQGWKKHAFTLKPTADGTDVRLSIIATTPGTYFVDMVSLFPKDTFKGRPNGLRKDLAEMVAAMKPAFVRFPGGCFVEGDEIENAVRWKQTIGDVAERPGRWNLWGYRSTDGLGFHEYIQFCEDLGAEALFVINVGMSHNKGRLNAYAVPMDQMGEWVQDALDAIEYCNGGPGTKWGAKRVAAGHPAPFNLKYIEIGNENGGPDYEARYALFYDAIKGKYPDVKVIANDWSGTPRSRPFDLVDEHFYNAPGWFLANADRYDKRDRAGAKVYVGEYAVTRECGLGNLSAAITEAAFMTGMERNSDLVTMASYAPLFCEPAWKRWNPNAINFNATQVYGTPAYHVQAMFGANRPDVVLPVKVDSPSMAQAAPRGRIGIGTWRTQSEFKNVRVTAPDGKVLWAFDPAKGVTQFAVRGGAWEVDGGVIRQTSDAEPAGAFVGDASWGDYTIELKARKLSGAEGFLISFHSTDSGTTSWWNVGGWVNREHGIEAPLIPQVRKRGSVETGRWYDVKVELRGHSVRCFLDGQLIQEATATNYNRLFAVAGWDRKAGEVVVKLVNPSDLALETDVRIEGARRVRPTGKAIVLTSGSLSDENSLDQPDKVFPRESKFEAGPDFRFTVPARSVTILRAESAK